MSATEIDLLYDRFEGPGGAGASESPTRAGLLGSGVPGVGFDETGAPYQTAVSTAGAQEGVGVFDDPTIRADLDIFDRIDGVIDAFLDPDRGGSSEFISPGLDPDPISPGLDP